jgi:hypothetical protein
MKSEMYYYARDQLLNLIKTDFDNLCEKNPKSDKNKLIQKAYKRNLSLNKITTTYKKYELFIPHETTVPTIIPFIFMNKMTNPSVQAFRQAQLYIEAYSEFKMIVDVLSKEEVKKVFDGITKESVKKINIKIKRFSN